MLKQILNSATNRFNLIAFASKSDQERFLLSMLERCHSRKNQLKQVHSQLITTGLHHSDVMGKEGMMIWNVLLRDYSQGSRPEEAFQLYKQMQEICSSVPTDSFTFSFLIKACANLLAFIKGMELHSQIIKLGFGSDVYVQTALVNMYSVCGLVSEAQKVFDAMPERNSVSWNAMITGLTKWGKVDLALSLFEKMPDRTVISWTGIIDGYTRIHRPMEALGLFHRMLAEDNIKPTEITILSIIPAISNLGDLKLGQSIHVHCKKYGFDSSDVRVSNSLIDMYGKCGSLEFALKLFDEIPDRNLVSWTSIISGLAMHGLAAEAIEQFERMEKEGLRPNQVTFLSVLNACSHGGLVEQGQKLFMAMVNEYGIEPGIKHYGCIIDLLGRVGLLEEAEKIIMGMPFEATVIVWRTLLGACSFHGNLELGERVMEKILELERGYSGDYVLLYNIYAGAGRWNDAQSVRKMMDDRKVLKIPGISLVDGNN